MAVAAGKSRRGGQRSCRAHGAGEAVRVGGRGEIERADGEIGSRLRMRLQHFVRGGIEAHHDRPVGLADALEQVRSGTGRRAAAVQQDPAELAVQRLPGRRRQVLGDRPPDELVAEGKGLGARQQEPGRHGLVRQREHDGGLAAQHLGHVIEPERATEHGRGLQHVADTPAQAAEPAPGSRA